MISRNWRIRSHEGISWCFGRESFVFRIFWHERLEWIVEKQAAPIASPKNRLGFSWPQQRTSFYDIKIYQWVNKVFFPVPFPSVYFIESFRMHDVAKKYEWRFLLGTLEIKPKWKQHSTGHLNDPIFTAKYVQILTHFYLNHRIFDILSFIMHSARCFDKLKDGTNDIWCKTLDTMNIVASTTSTTSGCASFITLGIQRRLNLAW